MGADRRGLLPPHRSRHRDWPHEAPWITTDSDEVFEVGDVLAIEPAAYSADLRGGVRVEDNYVVVEDGVRRLSRLRR